MAYGTSSLVDIFIFYQIISLMMGKVSRYLNTVLVRILKRNNTNGDIYLYLSIER